MKHQFLAFTCTLCVISSFAQNQHDEQIKQTQDSIKAHYLDRLAWKNPIIRQAGITTDVFASGDIKSDLNGKPFFEGKYHTVRTNAFFNAPIWQGEKNRISAGVVVSHQMMKLDNLKNFDPSLPFGKTTTQNTLLGGSLSFSRVDSLLKRPVVYSATAAVLIDPVSGQRRFTGSGVVSLTLHNSENTTFSVGLIGLVDPSMPIPVFPFISYWHRFNSGLEFSLDPSAIALRKELGSRSSLSLSNTVSGNLTLYKRDIVNLPIEFAFSTLEMKSGLVYEHLIGKKMVATLNGGIRSTFTSKILEGQSSKDPLITNTQAPVPYLRLGISFLPFWNGFSKK
jgi:hypothetical protein